VHQCREEPQGRRTGQGAFLQVKLGCSDSNGIPDNPNFTYRNAPPSCLHSVIQSRILLILQGILWKTDMGDAAAVRWPVPWWCWSWRSTRGALPAPEVLGHSGGYRRIKAILLTGREELVRVNWKGRARQG